MGERTTEQSSSTSVGPMTAKEQSLQDLLQNLTGDVAGTLSGMMGDSPTELDPEVEAKIEELFRSQADQEMAMLDSSFRQTLADTSDYLRARGIDDSSLETGALGQRANEFNLAAGGIQRNMLSGIANAKLTMPLQYAAADDSRINSLGNLLNVTANPLLRNMLETRLGNTRSKGTETVSGATLGELAPALGAI